MVRAPALGLGGQSVVGVGGGAGAGGTGWTSQEQESVWKRQAPSDGVGAGVRGGGTGGGPSSSILPSPDAPTWASAESLAAMSQASAVSPTLCSLLLLALSPGLAGALNPNDPNTCTFWER